MITFAHHHWILLFPPGTVREKVAINWSRGIGSVMKLNINVGVFLTNRKPIRDTFSQISQILIFEEHTKIH